ncbi:uncharacterized protein LOC127806794 [Diospyros lotus]|uniref:uncharacterized protein LOC127806794 n=1 Tax=Diospyros lotus TaxID=55363 RepID=UPI00224DEA68|nr:uncharacterized protein LOC127806794 [Diospyros lotus]
MMMLQFADPVKLKTKKIVFEDVYPAHDSGTLEQLKELSSKRRAIEESINGSKSITDAIAREMSGGLTSQTEQDLQKLEQYLPLLENLVYHVGLDSNSCIMRLTSDLKIRWSSALGSSSLFNLAGPKFFQIDNLQFEQSMTLFLYGAMLWKWASEILSINSVQSATLFRKAAGVYHYLALEVLPSLQALAPERPPEATSSVSLVMSLICLAEAQAVTIRKAEEKGNSGGLLAKLHNGVVQLLDEAAVILYSATKECKDISVQFVNFISSCKALHQLRSHKYLAESLKVAGQVGLAVGVVRRALTNGQKQMPGEESWRLVFKQEINELAELLRKYEHENDFVWHEKIPVDDELPQPEAKKIVSCIDYHPQKWERSLLFST